MGETAILVAGDTVTYHGTTGRHDGVFVMLGDRGTVVRGNEDYDDDAVVCFESGTVGVPASDLEWIG